MKKLAFVFMAIMMVSGSLMAQTTTKRATPEQRAKRHTEVLAKDLTLSADQKESVYKIVLAKLTKYDELKATFKGQKSEDRRAAFKKLREDFSLEMKNTLDPKQYELWIANRKAKAEKVKAKRAKIKEAKHVDSEESEDIF